MAKTKRIDIDLSEGTEININGHVFPLLLNLTDLLARGVVLQERATACEQHDVKGIIATIKEFIALIDDTLAHGATSTLMDGRAITLNKAVQLLNLIIEAMADEYGEKVQEYAQVPTESE